jgi:hypothetical protein
MANISPIEIGLGVVAALVGAALYEPIKSSLAALRARRPPLRRWYWQVTYRARDKGWRQLWSIELVEVYSRGQRVWGTMYRVFPGRYKRRWKFDGRVFDRRRLSLVYESVGDDYGSNGTVSLGVLNRWLWCGAFQQIPDAERDVELKQENRERRETRRIGPDFTEESLIEWLAADHEADDPVRGFLASIPKTSATAPDKVARHLPRRLRTILVEGPPFPTWFRRGLEAVGAQGSLLTTYAGERARRESRPVPRSWESPSHHALEVKPESEAASG